MSEALSPEHLERLAAGRRIFGGEPKFVVQCCEGGVLLYRSAGPQPKPGRIAAALDYHCPMSLVVDFSRAGIAIPEAIPRRSYLYKGFAAEVADELSPLFLPPTKRLDRFELLNQGWGSDSVLAIFSREDPTTLLLSLREASQWRDETREGLPSEEEMKSNGPRVVCIGTPSIFGSLLANGQADRVKGLMEGIDAVMFEGDGGAGWVIASGSSMGEELRRLGFQQE